MTGLTIEEAEARAATVPGSRFFSLIYDPFLWWAERAGMAERRRVLLASARGSVLELGAGTGLNLRHYPDDLDRLVLAEPGGHMARRLRKRLDRLGRQAELVRAPAEALPFDDGTFDTVVSTLVLCTVEDPEGALAEIGRVLRPGGSLLFLEHVRSENRRLARWQDRLHGPWRSFAEGCNCNRPTLELLRRAGFEQSGPDRARWRRMPPIVRPLVCGRARPAAAGRRPMTRDA
jgi:SAM-dependent methyltransferase